MSENWECTHCSAYNHSRRNTCWNCGAETDHRSTTRNNTEKLSFITIITVIAAIVTIFADSGIRDFILDQVQQGSIGWRSREERIINSLFPSMDIAVFEELLGSHIFVRTSENGFRE